MEVQLHERIVQCLRAMNVDALSEEKNIWHAHREPPGQWTRGAGLKSHHVQRTGGVGGLQQGKKCMQLDVIDVSLQSVRISMADEEHKIALAHKMTQHATEYLPVGATYQQLNEATNTERLAGVEAPRFLQRFRVQSRLHDFAAFGVRSVVFVVQSVLRRCCNLHVQISCMRRIEDRVFASDQHGFRQLELKSLSERHAVGT
jgi:hypothetical protein